MAPMDMWCYFVTPMLCVLYILSNRLSRYQSPRFLPLLRISSSGLLWAHFEPVIVSYIFLRERKDPIHFCLCFGIPCFFFFFSFTFILLTFMYVDYVFVFDYTVKEYFILEDKFCTNALYSRRFYTPSRCNMKTKCLEYFLLS